METWQKEGSDKRVDNTTKTREDTYLISPLISYKDCETQTSKHKTAVRKILDGMNLVQF